MADVPTDPTGAEIILGPRSWGRRPSTAGVVLHTTEYPTTARADAVRCITDQSRRTPTGGWAQPGSYNYLVHDAGAILAVPFLEASGGLNPGSSAWAPERFPWLKQLLPAAAYADPTMHHLQIAFSGRTAALLAALAARQAGVLRMVDTAARIIVWAERQAWAADNLVVSAHLHWQNNRSDPGQQLLDAVVARAVELTKQPTPTPPPDYPALYAAEVRKVADLTEKLQAARGRIALKDAHVGKYPTG